MISKVSVLYVNASLDRDRNRPIFHQICIHFNWMHSDVKNIHIPFEYSYISSKHIFNDPLLDFSYFLTFHWIYPQKHENSLKIGIEQRKLLLLDYKNPYNVILLIIILIIIVSEVLSVSFIIYNDSKSFYLCK